MSPDNKRKVAGWLRGQCGKLRGLPHMKMLTDNIERLEATADELDAEADQAEMNMQST